MYSTTAKWSVFAFTCATEFTLLACLRFALITHDSTMLVSSAVGIVVAILLSMVVTLAR